MRKAVKHFLENCQTANTFIICFLEKLFRILVFAFYICMSYLKFTEPQKTVNYFKRIFVCFEIY